MDYSLKELFPELNAKLNPSVYSPNQTDLENNTYFTHLVQNILG